MAQTLKIECLNAKHGDCFIAHYKSGKHSGMLLFDGGPAGVYAKTLKRRLEQLSADTGEPLNFALAVVTHIDDDHINGLLALTADLVSSRENQKRPLATIERFWHNSFTNLANHGRLAVGADIAASVDDNTISAIQSRDERTPHIISSVRQGRQLAANIESLNLAGNEPFRGLVRGVKTCSLPNGPKLKVIGPSQKRLDALKSEYDKVAAGPKSQASIAEYVDRSVPNLSSIVFILEHAGRRLLFTGDARGDDIIEYLEEANELEHGKVHFDLLKLPHHGSSRNLDPSFFEAVSADTYVISADGRHGNPDVDTLEWLSAASRGREATTVVLTNLPDGDANLKAALKQLADAATLQVRQNNDLSTFIEY